MTCLPHIFARYSVASAPSAPVAIADILIDANGDEVSTFRTHAYQIMDQGWGTKYSNPSTSPAGRTIGSNFRPQGDAVGWATLSVSPFAEAYAFTSGVGYGSKYPNMATLPESSAQSLHWAPDGNDVAVGTSAATTATRGIYAYAWSSGWGSKYSDPSGIKPGGRLRFGNTNSYLFTTETTSPFLAAYSWGSGAGFGPISPKFTDPAAAAQSSTSIPAINSNDTVVIVGQATTPYVKAYAFSGSGWGTAFSEPSTKYTTAATGSPNQIEFSPNDDYVAISHTGNVGEFNSAIYTWSSGWGTLLSDPVTVTTGSYQGINWIGSSFVIVTRSTSPYAFLYNWTGSSWGSREADASQAISATNINTVAVYNYPPPSPPPAPPAPPPAPPAPP